MSSFAKKPLLHIGPLTILPGLMLAPMAGITSYPFRILAKELGCPLLFSEMISARGVIFGGGRQEPLLYFTEVERPFGFQLFGSDPQIMAAAAKKLSGLNPDFIDLNLGCPARKVIANGDGGALLRKPQLCTDIFKAVVKAVNLPVTAKMRTGWDEKSVNVFDLADRAEEAGIAMLTVHGRTVSQGYGGRADWDLIGEVKSRVSIPVTGNGDVDSARAALDMLAHCRCDGVMIGRAARGNPWIFRSILAALAGDQDSHSPSVSEIIETTLRHFKLLAALKGEDSAAREMRRHSAWYIRGLPGAAAVRQELVRASCFDEYEIILKNFAAQLSSGN